MALLTQPTALFSVASVTVRSASLLTFHHSTTPVMFQFVPWKASIVTSSPPVAVRKTFCTFTTFGAMGIVPKMLVPAAITVATSSFWPPAPPVMESVDCRLLVNWPSTFGTSGP